MTGRRRAVILVAAALSAVALGACGKRGNPVPPEIRVPQVAGNLTAVEREGGIEVSWTVPRRRIDNSRLLEPGVARLYRVEDAGAGEPRRAILVDDRVVGYTEIATFRLQDPASAYLRGDHIVYPDRRALTYGRRYTYVVTTSDAQGRTSPPSARVSLTYIAPPAPPTALRAEPGDRSARLSWRPPAQLVDGTPVTDPIAYDILRAGDVGAEPSVVTRTAPGATSFEDRGLENDRSYSYTVRSVRLAGQASASGEAGERVAVTPVKSSLPAPPSDLVAVPSRGEVRLSWRASPDADVGAYVVYRAADGGGPATRVGAVRPPATTFVDRDVPAGTWHYTVVSQDTSARANESRPTNEVTVAVP